jgi:hypothetical protein
VLFSLGIAAAGQPTEPEAVVDDRPPRIIARFDVALLALPNVGPAGSGGGISIPIDGTGAGLTDGFGAELGAEVRLHRWLAFDASAGRYRSTLEVARDRGPDAMTDVRSAEVDLETLQLGLVVTPPKLRFEQGRAAMGALVMRATIPEVPSGLEITVDDSDTGVGVDFRADFFLSKDRRWGIGVALAFLNIDLQFVDLETADADSLQVSGMFLRLGIRGAW